VICEHKEVGSEEHSIGSLSIGSPGVDYLWAGALEGVSDLPSTDIRDCVSYSLKKANHMSLLSGLIINIYSAESKPNSHLTIRGICHDNFVIGASSEQKGRQVGFKYW